LIGKIKGATRKPPPKAAVSTAQGGDRPLYSLLSTSNGNADDATSTNTGSSDDANTRFAPCSGGHLAEATQRQGLPELLELPQARARRMQLRKEAWSLKSSRVLIAPDESGPVELAIYCRRGLSSEQRADYCAVQQTLRVKPLRTLWRLALQDRCGTR